MNALRLLLLLTFATLVCTGCSDDDNPASPGGGNTGPTVLLLKDGGSGDHVAAVLAAAGMNVRDGGLFYEFTGEGLADVDAVVLLNGIDYDHDISDAGQAALVGFVQAGGGLLTTEWLTYGVTRLGHYQILKSMLPTSYAGTYGSGTETLTVLADHPVTEGLPDRFATGGDHQYSVLSPKSGATQLLRGSRSGHAVVTWSVPGRVVSLNMAAEYGGPDVWNADIDRLLANAARWSAAQ